MVRRVVGAQTRDVVGAVSRSSLPQLTLVVDYCAGTWLSVALEMFGLCYIS
jgi:hypothetical protein